MTLTSDSDKGAPWLLYYTSRRAFFTQRPLEVRTELGARFLAALALAAVSFAAFTAARPAAFAALPAASAAAFCARAAFREASSSALACAAAARALLALALAASASATARSFSRSLNSASAAVRMVARTGGFLPGPSANSFGRRGSSSRERVTFAAPGGALPSCAVVAQRALRYAEALRSSPQASLFRVRGCLGQLRRAPALVLELAPLHPLFWKSAYSTRHDKLSVPEQAGTSDTRVYASGDACNLAASPEHQTGARVVLGVIASCHSEF